MGKRILKQYLDEDPALWEEIAPERAERDFRRIFIDPTPIFDELFLGRVVYTDVARYRLATEEGEL